MVAFEINITQSYLSGIEIGRNTISLTRIEQIAKIFKIEPYILLKKDL